MDTLNTQGDVVSTKDWLITLLIAAIPIVDFIMLFIWGFGDNTNINKANWAKATLLWFAILAVLYFLMFAVFGALFFSSINH